MHELRLVQQLCRTRRRFCSMCAPIDERKQRMTTVNIDPTGDIAVPSLSARRRAALAGHRARADRSSVERAPTRVFYAIFLIVGVLVAVGLVMVLSASSIVSVNNGGSAFTMFLKQLMWAGVGICVAIGTYRMPYHAWRLLNRPLLAFAIVLNVLPRFPIGITINGARAWVELGPVRFRRQSELTNPRRTLYPALIAWGFAVVLALSQSDFGAAVILSAIALTVLYMAGVPVRWIALSGAVAFVGAFMFLLTSASRMARWTAFLDIEGNRAHTSYQVWQSMLSIANGGLAGVGPGAGTSKWGYVPLAHSDFIFTVIAEEFGLIGSVLVIGGFATLTALGFLVAMRAPDYSGALLAAGITMWFGVQAIINIGGVIGVLPVTGLTLPLISYGGSSLMITLGSSGLLLNIARKIA
ncbi:MAG: cell division protein FtsW [Actinobacteria bacterium]|nr:cell division protein FtsW [Actinomycetota bacterium]